MQFILSKTLRRKNSGMDPSKQTERRPRSFQNGMTMLRRNRLEKPRSEVEEGENLQITLTNL
jgi:hypothetical protein